MTVATQTAPHAGMQPFPQQIINHQLSGLLELCWQDGTTSRLAHSLLRAHCRCAQCEQLFRTQGSRPAPVEEQRITAINPVADKGLNLVFSDGHGRGIFPWAYLHGLGLD